MAQRSGLKGECFPAHARTATGGRNTEHAKYLDVSNMLLYVGFGIPPVEAPLSPLSPQRCNLSFSRIFRPLPLKLLPPLPRLLKRLTGLINRKSDVARGNGSVPLTSLLLPSSAPSLKTHATMGLCSGCYLCTPGGTRTCCSQGWLIFTTMQNVLPRVACFMQVYKWRS
jgi:hypothetical protein